MLWSLACGDVFVTRAWWWECWSVCPSAEMGSTWTGLLGLGGRWEPESSEQQEPPAETRSRESRPTARRTILLSPSYPVTADLVVTTFVTPFPQIVTLFPPFVIKFQGFVTQIQQPNLRIHRTISALWQDIVFEFYLFCDKYTCVTIYPYHRSKPRQHLTISVCDKALLSQCGTFETGLFHFVSIYLYFVATYPIIHIL